MRYEIRDKEGNTVEALETMGEAVALFRKNKGSDWTLWDNYLQDWPESVRTLSEKLRDWSPYKTRAAFSRAYGIPVRTLEDWDSAIATPPAYVLDLLARAIAEEKTGRPAEFRVVSTRKHFGQPDGDEFEDLKTKSITAAIRAAENVLEENGDKYRVEIRLYTEDIDAEGCEDFDYFTFEI